MNNDGLLSDRGKKHVAKQVLLYALKQGCFTYTQLNAALPIVHIFLAAQLEQMIKDGHLKVIDEIRAGSSNYLHAGTYEVVPEMREKMESQLTSYEEVDLTKQIMAFLPKASDAALAELKAVVEKYSIASINSTVEKTQY